VKVPAEAFVIPVPLHVPPGVNADSVAGPSDTQKGPAGVIVASGAGFTTILVVFVSVQPLKVTEYVIVQVPTPAVTGLNTPVDAFVIPVPLHVPPAVAAVSVTEVPFEQKGPAGLIVASGVATVIVVVFVSVQPLPAVTVYVIVHVPTPAVPGSNVPAAALVIPVPLHVPPAVAAVSVTGAFAGQKGPAAVIVASGARLTVIFLVLVSVHPPTVTL
jgi:hypothetical protein